MAGPQIVEGTGVMQDSRVFAAKLRTMNLMLFKEMSGANRTIGKVVASKTKDNASVVGRMEALAAQSVRVSTAGGGVALKLGSSQYPFAFGAEYGAKKYEQFNAWRGNQWSGDWPDGIGYWFHPAIRDSRMMVMTAYLDAVRQAATSAGIDSDIPRTVSALDIARDQFI